MQLAGGALLVPALHAIAHHDASPPSPQVRQRQLFSASQLQAHTDAVRALLRRVRAFVHEYTGNETEAAGRGMETATAEESDVTLADSAESVTYPCVPLFFDGRCMQVLAEAAR